LRDPDSYTGALAETQPGCGRMCVPSGGPQPSAGGRPRGYPWL